MEGISIVIPVYNEAESLLTFLPELYRYCQTLPVNWEVIVVNDGSTDNSQEILERNNWIKVITHSQRQGYGSALKDGIRKAEFKYVCFIDGDSSYHPSLIQAGLKKLDRSDIVIGARDEKSEDFPLSQKLARFFISSILTVIFRQRVKDINSGLRIINKEKIIPYLDILPDGFSFSASLTLLMLLEKFKFSYFPIKLDKRKGRSKLRNTTYIFQFTKCLYLTQYRWLKKELSSLG
jgi:glycosyltransferase involved in cell wall biosynthesis